MGFVYLLQRQENRGSDLFKIGCSTLANNSRMFHYGRDAEVFAQHMVRDARWVEQKLIRAFRSRFDRLYGTRECFHGDIKAMCETFDQLVAQHGEERSQANPEAKPTLRHPYFTRSSQK